MNTGTNWKFFKFNQSIQNLSNMSPSKLWFSCLYAGSDCGTESLCMLNLVFSLKKPGWQNIIRDQLDKFYHKISHQRTAFGEKLVFKINYNKFDNCRYN